MVARYVGAVAYVVYVAMFYTQMCWWPAWFSDDFTWLIGDAIATVLVLMNIKRQPAGDQGVWALWGTAAVLYAVGNLLYSLHLPGEVYNVMYLGCSVAMLAGCVNCVAVMNVPMTQLVGDAMGAAALAMWLVGDTLPRAVFTGEIAPLDGVTNLCLSVLDFAMLAGHVMLIIKVKGIRTRRAVLMALCFISSVVLDQLSVAMDVYGLADTWLVMHPFWSLPFMLLGLASTYTYKLPRLESTPPVKRWFVLAHIAAHVAICVALLHGAMVNDDPVSRIVGLSVVTMLVVRQSAIDVSGLVNLDTKEDIKEANNNTKELSGK